MPRTQKHAAIVLKTYDIGDADRFCVLLTDGMGRITACAKGVRKPKSKWSGMIQSFQHLQIELSEHSSGFYLRSAECINSFPSLRSNVQKFALASHGAELLLQFLHDSEPSEKIFAIACDFFAMVDQEPSKILFSTFQLMLMKELGLLPSFAEDGKSRSDALQKYLTSNGSLQERIQMELSDADRRELTKICDVLIREQLSFPLKSGCVSC